MYLRGYNWMWQVSVHWLKNETRISLIRVDSDGRITVQEVGSSVCGFSLRCRVLERPLPTMVARPWLLIWALLTPRSLSWQMYSSHGSHLNGRKLTSHVVILDQWRDGSQCSFPLSVPEMDNSEVNSLRFHRLFQWWQTPVTHWLSFFLLLIFQILYFYYLGLLINIIYLQKAGSRLLLRGSINFCVVCFIRHKNHSLRNHPQGGYISPLIHIYHCV